MKDLVPDLVKINQYRTLAANVELLKGSACTIVVYNYLFDPVFVVQIVVHYVISERADTSFPNVISERVDT